MRWVFNLFQRRRMKREAAEEVEAHVEEKVAELMESGMSADEARQRASREFGSAALYTEIVREAWGWTSLDRLGQDLRYGLRMMRRNPGFTAVAALSLALGIGANTAIFSLVDAILLRTLPVQDPERLVQIQAVFRNEAFKLNKTTQSFSRRTFEYFRDRNQVFADTFAFDSLERPDVTVDGGAEYTRGVDLVSGNYFSALGVNAILGRVLTLEEDKTPGAHPVAVISYGYWKRRFGLNPAILGKNISVNDVSFSIIGVAPPRFFGLSPESAPDLWLPTMMQARLMPDRPYLDGSRWWLKIMARLKPGVNQEQAQADLNVLFPPIEKEMSPKYMRFSGRPVELVSASRGYSILRRQFSQPLTILMIVVGMVLLIACANVASLLLARATARRNEISIRLAVGAGRFRLVRQLVTESLLLASMGGALGLMFASWGSRALLNLLPHGPVPMSLDLHPDVRILGFTTALSLLTGMLFGLAPAVRGTRVDLKAGLGKAASGTRPGLGLGKLLVISQVALSLLLLVSAGLFVRSLQKLKKLDLGINPENLLQVAIDTQGYKGARLSSLYGQLLERLSSIPGVRSASGSGLGLIAGLKQRTTISVPGNTTDDENAFVDSADVGPRFFETAGQPLLLGRDITAADSAGAPKVVVINESMARHYFGNENPIGKRLGYGPKNNAEFEIVGVAKDARFTGVREQIPLMMYFPSHQRAERVDALQVRTIGNPAAIAAAVRREVQAVDKRLLVDIKTLSAQVDDSLVQERMISTLAGFFSLLALLLAIVGLYGIMAYSVTRRTSEIGIRMALGAERRDVLWLVLRETMILVMTGIAIGVPAALAVGRLAGHLVSGLLFGLTATDPITIAIAALLLAGGAAVAGYLPARRASRVDPMLALRYE
jgi:macrolide transport system ATP-binding/permease protein